MSQFPWLSRLIGRRSTPMVGTDGAMTEAGAEIFCTTAFLPASVTKSVSAGRKAILKARAFMVALIFQMQTIGMAAMLTVFAKLLRTPTGDDNGNVIVLGVTHSWDETKQLLREHRRPENAFLKQPAQRIGKNVLVQSSTVHAMGVLGGAGGEAPSVYHRAESFLIAPLEVAGKTADFLASAILRSMPIPLGDATKLAEVANRVSALVVTMWGDAASTNRRFLKHLCGLCNDEHWPNHVLLDPSQRCLLHQLHRVKTNLLEGHAIVSLSYCFGRLIRAGSLLGLVGDSIASHIESSCVRLVEPPPADLAARSRRVFDLLFGLDASHHLIHGTKGTNKSQLLSDVEFLLAMDGAGLCDRQQVVHYCWKSDGTGPCCKDYAECVDKLQAAYLNLFMCHSTPSGSLSRWTHVGAMLTMLSCGFVCRDIYYNAVLTHLPEASASASHASSLETGAVGAGDGDFVAEHAARVVKVRTWLGNPSTRLHIGVLCMLVKIVDSIMYFLMGGNTKDGARSRRPGTTPRTEEPLPFRELLEQVSGVAHKLFAFLSHWDDSESDAGALLRMMGVDDAGMASDTTLRFARRHCLGFSVGVYRRFIVRLRSFPYRLWVIADGSVDQRCCSDVAAEFLRQPSCCIGFFGQRLRELCPDVASLLGRLGRATVATWLRTLVWSIYQCEKEHASCRRLLLGAGPARNWTLCARERVLERSRVVHMERVTADGAGDVAERASSAERLAAAVGQGMAPPSQNPLLPITNIALPEVGFEIASVGVTSDLSGALVLPSADGGPPAADAALVAGIGNVDDERVPPVLFT